MRVFFSSNEHFTVSRENSKFYCRYLIFLFFFSSEGGEDDENEEKDPKHRLQQHVQNIESLQKSVKNIDRSSIGSKFLVEAMNSIQRRVDEFIQYIIETQLETGDVTQNILILPKSEFSTTTTTKKLQIYTLKKNK
jgi:hypothetical protein